MNLAEAIHVLATSGCRLSAGPDGGIILDVPEGAAVDAAVLDVLTTNREQLIAVVAPAAPAVAEDRADDLADYLATRGITGASAELVEHAAATFAVRHQAITIEREDGEPTPTFFDPGIPFTTTVDTEWHEPGIGTVPMQAGTLGLAIPQTWAIADDALRGGIESIAESIKRRKLPMHVPVWINGRPRVIEAALITFDNVVAPAGMDLTPWRRSPLET